MTEINDGWDDFLNEAAKDDRIGKHKATVISLVDGTWPAKNGEPERPYTEVGFKLSSGSEIDLRWSAPPDTPPTKAELAAMDKGVRQGMVNAVTMRRQLAQHYSKAFDRLSIGDQFGLKIEPRKSKKDGKFYSRVVAFVPLEECDVEKTASTDDIPF